MPAANLSNDATLLLNLLRANGTADVRVRTWTMPSAKELQKAGLVTIGAHQTDPMLRVVTLTSTEAGL